MADLASGVRALKDLVGRKGGVRPKRAADVAAALPGWAAGAGEGAGGAAAPVALAGGSWRPATLSALVAGTAPAADAVLALGVLAVAPASACDGAGAAIVVDAAGGVGVLVAQSLPHSVLERVAAAGAGAGAVVLVLRPDVRAVPDLTDPAVRGALKAGPADEAAPDSAAWDGRDVLARAPVAYLAVHAWEAGDVLGVDGAPVPATQSLAATAAALAAARGR
jgi:hypothetical protein